MDHDDDGARDGDVTVVASTTPAHADARRSLPAESSPPRSVNSMPAAEKPALAQSSAAPAATAHPPAIPVAAAMATAGLPSMASAIRRC